MPDSPYIIDVNRENFQELMETSFRVPVLLDFWASWCQPCQVLMPILAKLADEYEGKFLLGKINTEEQQEIAAHFGIRSIPTVKAFRDGQPVDEFMGALPESAVREFLDRQLGQQSGDESTLAALELALAKTDEGDFAAAASVLDSLPDDEQDKPEVVSLRSRLYFAGQLSDEPASGALETLHQSAVSKVIAGDYDSAVELFLELMKKDRSFGDDIGRRDLLKVFELLGDDPRVSRYRSRMTSLLY
ncbi:MAG: thioredoxin [Woeseiaceae bacterium]|nr:thioredoxin [Woeseiaceae bacterium]